MKINLHPEISWVCLVSSVGVLEVMCLLNASMRNLQDFLGVLGGFFQITYLKWSLLKRSDTWP